jgi:hypothetical protein
LKLLMGVPLALLVFTFSLPAGKQADWAAFIITQLFSFWSSSKKYSPNLTLISFCSSKQPNETPPVENWSESKLVFAEEKLLTGATPLPLPKSAED